MMSSVCETQTFGHLTSRLRQAFFSLFGTSGDPVPGRVAHLVRHPEPIPVVALPEDF